MKKLISLLILLLITISTASFGDCCGVEDSKIQKAEIQEENSCPHHQSSSTKDSEKKEKRSCSKICCLNISTFRPIVKLKVFSPAMREIQITYQNLNQSIFIKNLLRPPIA